MNNLNTKYKGQALAIAMVVLVVSSIIGLSVYSRISKEKTQTLDERASAESLEVSDFLLDYISSKPIEDVLGATTLNKTLTESTEPEITNLLKSLNINEDLSQLNICPVGQTGNEYYLNISIADENTYFEIRPGQTFSIPVRGTTFNPLKCTPSITLSVVPRGDTDSGFSVSKIFGKDYTTLPYANDYKDYTFTDTRNYCFSSGSVCNNTETFQDGWEIFKDNNTEKQTYLLNEVVSTYPLDEIKIKAVGGTIGISYKPPVGCEEGFRMIKIQAGATCNGVYRGKEILVPERKWTSPVFDYVLFNGEGNL